MNTSKVNRVQIIDHTVPLEEGGACVYTKWVKEGTIDVTVQLQDGERTLKVFINERRN